MPVGARTGGDTLNHLSMRTLLSWLHRVTPVERENRARPSDTVSLHPTSLVRAQTRLRFYIVQNNMQYSDAHRRYNFVRGGLSLTVGCGH